MTVLASIDAVLASEATHGAWRRNWYGANANPTSPTASAGGPVALSRHTNTITVPSMGAGILGCYLTECIAEAANTSGQSGLLVGLEYQLGSLDFSTATFTAGVSMPSKRFSGMDAVQSSSQLTAIVATAALTATTPTVTITYTNQNGDSSRSAAVPLPTNPAAGSGYLVTTFLQSGDTGMRSVSNMTKSAGTAGTAVVYGYLVLSISFGASGSELVLDPSQGSWPSWLLEAGDEIGFLEIGANISRSWAHLVGVAET